MRSMLDQFLVMNAAVLTLSSDKKEAIRDAVGALTKELDLSANDVYTAVMEREQVMSTGMGHGVAIPHAKIKGLKKFAIAISKSAAPIDYGALDATPVRILALLLSPESQTKEHVQMIAYITKRLKFSHIRQAILDAKTGTEIESAFLSAS